MTGRRIDEIVADLRDARGPGNSYMEPDHRPLMSEAADRLAFIDALRLPCPTCGGTGIVLVVMRRCAASGTRHVMRAATQG